MRYPYEDGGSCTPAAAARLQVGTNPAVYRVGIMNEPKRYDEQGELIQDSDGSWVSGWYTVEDENGNTYPVKDRD